MLPSGGPTMPSRSMRIEQAGGAAVSDAEAALQRGGRGLAHFEHDVDGVVVQLVEFAVAFAGFAAVLRATSRMLSL